MNEIWALNTHGRIHRERGSGSQDLSHPWKSQTTISVLRNTDTDPLEKQLDP